MALLFSLPPPSSPSSSSPSFSSHCFTISLSSGHQSCRRIRFLPVAATTTTHNRQHSIPLDKSSLAVAEASEEDQLWAAACLHVRSFYDFQASSYGIHFTSNGEDRVVVGTLDLNQCLWLPEEIAGTKPEGIEADFGRAYLSNVCVARELHRNGLGYDIVTKSKIVAEEWGITDLYVHVAVDNEPAKNLYMKSGFIHENDEPAWQARFLDRPRRILLWIGLPCTNEL
ncbi:hypothetical protein E1A91_D08G107100v1 [Gossypium mustelinum]|uniref:N-acetyltransferase domain-containing protein n=1 Tax=Gossypium mustelinum TaxID=34275 RepID=A0A5D2TWU0_GOSMU|nr:hypothetical protein E1A91_D08G107100v1 [Gossypium mustelinum]